ncbi:MAG: hypothetical protein CMO80_13305 [Verrucomicrobiales bacterium]|nr:hypothetical protein [Verrucomicrobiales bacterium]|tara:strand:+ start:6549 stop:6884 length:336 start_codon:yes stop_codon:yes gene_type:complete
MIKKDELRVFQLGSGKNKRQIYFGLKSDGDLIGVINNETGAFGAAIPSIMMKAIEEGEDLLAVEQSRVFDIVGKIMDEEGHEAVTDDRLEGVKEVFLLEASGDSSLLGLNF